jgi:AraC family transcriptional regulator, regulatory protein of adaptative response / methylated-DNA-[protein]-cysteine methyltransferase
MSRSPRSRQPNRDTAMDSRWAAIVARDSGADGKFYYSVETTGVYCRPSCASRHPRVENVRFHESCADAELAGFRPCLRCKPDKSPVATHGDAIANACRVIEASEAFPGVEYLSRHAGLSPFYFHRLFKAFTGVTPRQYAAEHRSKRTRSSLAKGLNITDAIYEGGFNSSGRFYEISNKVLGMTPSKYRAGGAHTDIRFAVGECSLGSILVASSERGICAILLGDDPDALARDLQDRFPQAITKHWFRRSWASWKRQPLDLTSPLISAVPPFNSVYGRR